MGPSIGLNLTTPPGGWRITTGYDDVIHARADGSWLDDVLSNAEAREIAEYMIKAWTEYRDSIPSDP